MLAALRHGSRGTQGSRDSSSPAETVFVLSKGRRARRGALHDDGSPFRMRLFPFETLASLLASFAEHGHRWWEVGKVDPRGRDFGQHPHSQAT